jgi:hypothetical protein
VLNHHEEALKLNEEALNICCHPATEHPDISSAYFTLSLDTLSPCPSELEEPLAATEAMTIHQCLEVDQPNLSHSDLTWSLDILATHVLKSAHYKEALRVSEENSVFIMP